jgi:hypothetical protein
MPGEGTFALALDGAKRQVKSVTSNPGHCLYCEVIDADKVSIPVLEEDPYSVKQGTHQPHSVEDRDNMRLEAVKDPSLMEHLESLLSAP